MTTKLAMFDLAEKRSGGMRGYLASRFSLNMKKTDMTAPNTIKQMTLGEFQGNVTPPKSRPRRTIKVSPMMLMLPSQSIALTPSISDVFGLCTSRNSWSKTKATPATGRLIHQHQRQDTSWVRAPPSTGPAPPAAAQTNSQNPR